MVNFFFLGLKVVFRGFGRPPNILCLVDRITLANARDADVIFVIC